METEKTSIAIYRRVSTLDEKQLISFEHQEDFTTEYLKNNPQFKLYKEYSDRGTSGTLLVRPGFEQLLYDAGLNKVEVKSKKGEHRKKYSKYVYIADPDRQPLFKYIVTKSTSRFARNTEISVIIKELINKGVYVKFLASGLSSENKSDALVLGMLYQIDEGESTIKAEAIRVGHDMSAKKGNMSTNGRLFGYTYNPQDKSLTIREDEAIIVRKIFEMYSEGKGLRTITNYLFENGIKTRTGKDFIQTTVRNIIANPKYCGTLVRNRYRKGELFSGENNYAKERPEEEWEIFEDNFEGIISKELFNKCKELMQSKVNRTNQKGIYHGKHALAGLIICDKCGKTYINQFDRGRRYYVCNTKRKRSTKACDNLNVNYKTLENEINKLRSGFYNVIILAFKDIEVYSLLKLKNDILNKLDKSNEDILKDKNNELELTIQSQDRLLDLYLTNILTKEKYEAKHIEIENKINLIKNEIYELSKTNDDLLNDVAEIDNVLEEIKSIEIQDDYTFDEMINLIDKIIVKNDNGKAKLVFKYKVLRDYWHIVEKYEVEM